MQKRKKIAERKGRTGNPRIGLFKKKKFVSDPALHATRDIRREIYARTARQRIKVLCFSLSSPSFSPSRVPQRRGGKCQRGAWKDISLPGFCTYRARETFSASFSRSCAIRFPRIGRVEAELERNGRGRRSKEKEEEERNVRIDDFLTPLIETIRIETGRDI